MRVEDAANRLGVSQRTILRWIHNGRLRTHHDLINTEPFGVAAVTDIWLDDLIDAADDPRFPPYRNHSVAARRRHTKQSV